MRAFLLALGLLLLAPATGRAQSEDPDALIQQGLALRRERRDEEALALFRRAHALRPEPRALAQIALAEQATGRFVAAREHLAEALAAEDPWIEERREPLGAALASIEQRLGRLEITGGAGAGEIRIDGVVRGTMPLAEPLWVPAGRLVVEVARGEGPPFNRTVMVSPGGLARVHVEVLAGPPDTAEVPVEEPVEEAPAVPPVRADAGPGATMIGGGVSLGVAAVALGIGIAFHVAREGDAQTFNGPECEALAGPGQTLGEACPDVLTAIRRSEIGMGVGYAAAGALAILGLVLVLVDSPEPSGQALACSPSGAGVHCSGRF